ncbi:MAG TPA: DUF5522 domain-containing protein [Cyclobacteriaceae bacterium]|nr:DUF5522 domain-containing protein [Cyclobacteriaceae bacterium]HRJ83061.1 DUF5522 domain-containing protein [Cyclobacteriaceae bacterium]
MRVSKDRKNKSGEGQVKAEPDYYIEHGNVVFTAAYHKKRGYCCQSGCRHCPYGDRKK